MFEFDRLQKGGRKWNVENSRVEEAIQYLKEVSGWAAQLAPQPVSLMRSYRESDRPLGPRPTAGQHSDTDLIIDQWGWRVGVASPPFPMAVPFAAPQKSASRNDC